MDTEVRKWADTVEGYWQETRASCIGVAKKSAIALAVSVIALLGHKYEIIPAVAVTVGLLAVVMLLVAGMVSGFTFLITRTHFAETAEKDLEAAGKAA